MRGLFRLGGPTTSELTGEEQEHHGNGRHHHHHNGLFSHHNHHSSTGGDHGRSGSSEGPTRTSSNPTGSNGRSSSARHAQYPEALPSALSKRFTGPAIGTAVLDESIMPLEDAAVLFEMVTPASTPLLKSHVKERFEAAIDEAIEQRRKAAQEQHEAHASSDSANGSSDEPTSEPQVQNNTFSFFKVDYNVAASSPQNSSNARHHRRHVLNDGGYFVFTDSYLSAHPNSVVTGVTSELQLAAADDISPFHHRVNGPDADKQRLQEVKDYIREVEHEYRPLFRRRTSEMVYGRSMYLHTSSPDLTSSEVYYATPMTEELAKYETDTTKKSKSKLRKVFSSPMF